MTTPSSLGEQIKQLAREYRHGEGWPILIYHRLAKSVDALVSLAEASTPAREAGAVAFIDAHGLSELKKGGIATVQTFASTKRGIPLYTQEKAE